MKRSLISRFFATAVAAAILSSSFGLEASTTKLDKIKYPELSKFELPAIHKSRTSNGIRLRLIKNEELPLIDLEILLRGGDVYDPAKKIGLAFITAQVLRIGGTEDLPADQLDRLLDSRGIDISIDADTDYFSISLSCLEENFEEALSILSRMLLRPAFDNEKLIEIQAHLRSEVSRRNDQPSSINAREFNKLVYGADSPFAAVLEYEHIDSISRDDIYKHYKTFFAPDNMLVGISGPMDTAEVKAAFEKYFGQWHHKSQVPSYPAVKEQEHDFKVAFAEKSNLNQSYLSIGHLGVKDDLLDVKEKARLMVFNSIFSRGFTSRLMTRVRVKMGLTYGIGGGIITRSLYPGKTYFTTFTKSKSTLQAIKAIFEEIDIIKREKVSDRELQDAKDYFLNSYVFNFSSPEKILFTNLTREFYGIDEDIDEKLIASIKNVTAGEVLDVANRYLYPEKMVIFIVGREQDIEGDLSELGKIKKIDISIKN